MHDKTTLRLLMRERLRAIDDVTRQKTSAQIASHILHHIAAERGSLTLALFGGLKNEPDFLPQILPVLNAQGARLTCFQIDSGELRPRQVQDMDDLQRGQMNVWEPKSQCPSVEIAQLDLILVPGLAFTREGLRLGRGGGYYDRLLARLDCRARRVGVAYDLQMIDFIPIEPHDQIVHQIITESGLIDASASH